MKSAVFYFVFLFFAFAVMGQQVNVCFIQGSKKNYCSQMTLNARHYPNCWANPGNSNAWFCFQDSSMVYYTRRSNSPNIKKFRHILNEKIKNHDAPSDKIITFDNDTLYVYVFEGIDSCGRYWKEIVYVVSRLVIQNLIGTNVSIGYVNVQEERVDEFNSMLDSFKILPSSEFDWTSREFRDFIYLEKPKEFLLDGPRLDYFFKFCDK
jgi:hypothetical protein